MVLQPNTSVKHPPLHTFRSSLFTALSVSALYITVIKHLLIALWHSSSDYISNI